MQFILISFNSVFFQLKPCHPCLIWKDHIMKTLQIKAMGPSNSVFSSSNFFGTWIFKIHQHCLQLFLKALLLTAHNNVVNSCSKSGAYHLSAPFGNLLREPGGCHTTTQEPYTLPQKGCWSMKITSDEQKRSLAKI